MLSLIEQEKKIFSIGVKLQKFLCKVCAIVSINSIEWLKNRVNVDHVLMRDRLL